jgi:hypothetical protein
MQIAASPQVDAGYSMGDGRSTQIGKDAAPRRLDGAARCPCLRAWMKLAMHSLEPLLIDMGIHLGRRYVRMAQHLLDDSKIRAVAKQMRCEAVPKKVRINILLQSGALRVLFNDLPNPCCG